MLASSQPRAERPRTGTTVTTATAPAIRRRTAADAHACRLNAQSTGRTQTASTVACHPVSPNGNQPIRAREYSL
ncbi:MAG: hypothetical protein HHJ11_18785 [Phycicoccus sp.]|nr:hypothetical protein [Phycicoccus sp.]